MGRFCNTSMGRKAFPLQQIQFEFELTENHLLQQATAKTVMVLLAHDGTSSNQINSNQVMNALP